MPFTCAVHSSATPSWRHFHTAFLFTAVEKRQPGSGQEREQVRHKGCHLKSCHGSHYKGIHTAQSSAHLNLKRLTLLSAGNDMKQGEISCTADGTINENNYFGGVWHHLSKHFYPVTSNSIP